MPSVAAICNLALSHLGTRATIASLDEASVEARVCKTHYVPARDTLLRDFDWNFARHVVTMAARSETPPDGWSYVYSVPNKCARFRGIWAGPRPTGKPTRWQLGGIVDTGNNDALAIFANESPATGVYTRIIENSELFSAGFVTALSWRLAAQIAYPITTKDSIADNVRKASMMAVAQAMADEANEGITETDQAVPDFLSARGYTD